MWTTVVYNCQAYWVWGAYIDPNNWLAEPLGWLAIRGTIDFAGGSVINIASGFAGLVTSIFLGKRENYSKESIKPHNTSLAALGMTLLWMGWFGYTCGSGGAVDGIAAFVVVNTQVAGSLEWLFGVILEHLVYKRVMLAGAVFRLMSRLVAISPVAGYVWLGHALIFGLFATIFGFFIL